MFYDAKINYMAKPITQASHAKDQLERLHIKKKKNTVFSLDIESFYPSVTYSLVETATNYFSKNLPMKEILMIRECLKLIHFGMGNTLITFEDKYYEYDSNRDVNDKGLIIGGYESAWLADLVAAFVLENRQHMFEMTTFNGIYRDDGLVVMKGIGPNRTSLIGYEISKKKSTE
jgi:hypothetical protein